MAGVVIVTRGTDEDQAEGNRDLEIATCPANCPETPQPLQSRFLNRGSFPKLADFTKPDAQQYSQHHTRSIR